jgi:hypothetical protein
MAMLGVQRKEERLRPYQGKIDIDAAQDAGGINEKALGRTTIAFHMDFDRLDRTGTDSSGKLATPQSF